MRWQWLLWGFIAFLSAGCTHAVSSGVRQQVDTTLSLAQIRSAPDAYKGRIIMLGGDIVSTRNLAEGTLIEVLHKPLDSRDRPLLTDRTEGRFMALCQGYLDPAIYSTGREITLAGRVEGSRTDTVGELTYVYPLISCLEVHLWPPRPAVVYYPPGYAYPYWWPYPYWWRRHAWYPFWW